jgi:hypothetical protein
VQGAGKPLTEPRRVGGQCIRAKVQSFLEACRLQGSAAGRVAVLRLPSMPNSD